MEDGKCHQMKRENSVAASENFDNKLSVKRSDKCHNINGGIDKYNQTIKTNQACKGPHDTTDDLRTSYTFQDSAVKNEFMSKKYNVNEQKITPEPVPKIPRPIITKHSTFKRVLKRSNERAPTLKLPKENGDHKHSKYQLSSKGVNEKAHKSSFHHLQNQPAATTKVTHKRRKVDAPQQSDYAQYLGLQPAVKFKCGKCCCSSFESLGMLKEHQRFCTPQTPATTPPAPPPPCSPNTNFRITRKVYLCSACGTYYENWNLFLHIREVHNRHTCLFCFGMFSQAQKLASHLVIKHNIQEDYFTSKEALSSKFSQSFYLLCCKCEKVFTERENFVSHECSPVLKQCSTCKLKGFHTSDCPKNFKHKKLTSVPDEVKKVKKTQVSENNIHSPKLVGDKNPEYEKFDHKHISNLKSQDVSEAENLVCENTLIDSSISSGEAHLVNTDNLNTVSDIRISTVTNEVIKNNNNKEDSLISDTPVDSKVENMDPESDISDEENVKKYPEELSQEEEPFSVPDEQFDQDREHTALIPFDRNIKPQETVPNIFSSENPSTVPVKSPTNASLSFNEPLKSASKPPPRNRRPPKRYQFKNSQESSQNVVSLSENKDKEPVNRVPKLTVKIPKILMEKESTSDDYSSESEDSDKLTVDFDVNNEVRETEEPINDSRKCDDDLANDPPAESIPSDPCPKKSDASADSDIVLAGEDIPIVELTLNRPLDRYPLKDLLKVLLTATVYNCIYCNHARKVAVNAKQLALHFVAQHRFSATVDSITAEELMPETIVLKMKTSLVDVQDIYINLEGFDSEDKSNMKYYDHSLECFQCFYVTTAHKELYLHNRKMHQKTILLCVMCKSNFYSYSELLCHLCPGTYVLNSEIQFRCCLCQHDTIPSAFRLMVHLRKCHHACDVCLETCQNQSKLTNHVWKHKLHHLCYRCGIAYRNKPDITKHLFWKHGTESVLCKKCLQKRWPHVYHFCIPPNSFVCEECNLTFSKAVALKVHKRLHTNDQPYVCTEPDCSEKFISKKLLRKHEIKHLEPPEHLEDPPKQLSEEKSDITVNEKKSDETNVELDKSDIKVTSTKAKKSKKNKKNKDKDNLLIDVNLPALNLSESDSSDESEVEAIKKSEENIQNLVNDDVEMRIDPPEDPLPEPPVIGIWDNFKLYQAQVEKQTESFKAPRPRHVCESDHDYCVIPTNEEDHAEEIKMTIESPIKENRRKLSKSKKKSGKKSNGSSSSDSSSDSDSSCSCGSNCSCSSSSGSSSSSSSSSDSESSSTLQQSRTTAQKDSDASAVDIMATEESPPGLPLPEPLELPIAESDLDTDETETDEDFYDEHPQRLANKILAEKRNQLMLLAAVAPVNNGTYLDSSRPVTPENVDNSKELKKKVKTKKRKKVRKTNSSRKQKHDLSLPVSTIDSPLEEPKISIPNKITISLQTNTVIDKSSLDSPKLSIVSTSDSDNKRASKRRRVPNKFYGYSSDEDSMPKPQLPPKLEWRKEDLPSPSGVQQPVITDAPSLADILTRDSKPIMSPKFPLKEPIYASSSEESESSREGALQINHPLVENERHDSLERQQQPVGFNRPPMGLFPFPRPTGVRQAREGESVYCYCRCPYDEVSEMIACDGVGCSIEWFHFECVGIMVPPKGKWFCPDCRQKLDNPEV